MVLVAAAELPVSWTRGSAALYMSPLKLVKFGSETTRGEIGSPDGCGTTTNRAEPAIRAPMTITDIGATGALSSAFRRRTWEANQNPARQSAQRAARMPTWESQA